MKQVIKQGGQVPNDVLSAELQLDEQQTERRIQMVITDKRVLSEQREAIQLFRDYMHRVRRVKVKTQVSALQYISIFGRYIKKNYLKTNKTDVIAFVEYLRRKEKPYSESTVLVLMQRVKGFIEWLSERSINQIEEEYRERIENEPNKKVMREFEDERDRLINRLSRNFKTTFPKDLFKDLGLSQSAIPDKYQPEDLLSREEVLYLIDSCVCNRDKALLAMMYSGGFRIHEILQMRINDIIPVGKGLIAKVGENTKTGARQVPLVEFVAYLKKWIDEHPYKKDKEAPLFISFRPNQFGRPLKYQGVSCLLSRLLKRTGFKKKISTHLFRHVRTTIDLEEGVKPDDIRIMRGWTKSSNMLQHYSHRSSNDVARRMLGVEEVKNKKIENKVCGDCGEEQSPTDIYCALCGGLLVDKDSYKDGEKIQLKNELLSKLLSNPNVQEAVKKALKEMEN